jgi:hypothetical protein
VRPGFLRRLPLIALFLCAMAARAAAGVPESAVTLGDVTQSEIHAAKPGHVLRIYPQIGGASSNAKAYRILYRSTGSGGEPIAVSGTVIFPAGPAPREGCNIIACAHYTTGVAQRCAPTLLPDLSDTIAGLDDMLAHGYVVVATDYEGLGVPGVHPYLVGVSEAHVVLDSVRAARELPATQATNRFAVWGHSQGGHAALFTGELAGQYAPELKLVGVAAAAPATYLVDLFKADRGTIGGNSLTAMALLSWSQVYRLPLDGVLGANAVAPFELVASSCIQSIAELLKLSQVEKPLQRIFLKADPTTLPVWREIMERNTPGPGFGRSTRVHRAGNGGRDGEARDHSALCQATVRRRHAGRADADEGCVPQLDRGEERAPGHQMDDRPLRGAPRSERLRPLT